MQKIIVMKNRTIFVILILTMISSIGMAQQSNEKIDYIAFRFEHSRRIPYKKVSIELIKRQTETVVKVYLVPGNNEKQWKASKLDTTFTIKKSLFTEISNEVSALNKIDLTRAFIGGKDGTECVIEFGTFGSTIAYKFWSPDYETAQRGLSDFLSLCKRMIVVGGLNPKEIL